ENDSRSFVFFLPVFGEMYVEGEIGLFGLLVGEGADAMIRALSFPDLQEMSTAGLRGKLGGSWLAGVREADSLLVAVNLVDRQVGFHFAAAKSVNLVHLPRLLVGIDREDSFGNQPAIFLKLKAVAPNRHAELLDLFFRQCLPVVDRRDQIPAA